MLGLPFWLSFGLVCLVGLGIVATVLSIVNIVRLTQIYHVVHQNFAAQREEIVVLQTKLGVALQTIGLRDQALDLLRDSSRSSEVRRDAAC